VTTTRTTTADLTTVTAATSSPSLRSPSRTPRATHHRIAHAVVAIAIVGVLTGCASKSGVRLDAFGVPVNAPITRAQLAALPEAKLRYPGSVEVKSIGSDEVATKDPEPDPAYTGAILTAAATPTQLYAWYTQWLTARGYQQVTYYRMTDQVSGMAWRAPKSREQVQVSVFDPAQLAEQQHITAQPPAGGVVYEAVLVGYRVNTR
jgi:hypothetical protein